MRRRDGRFVPQGFGGAPQPHGGVFQHVIAVIEPDLGLVCVVVRRVIILSIPYAVQCF